MTGKIFWFNPKEIVQGTATLIRHEAALIKFEWDDEKGENGWIELEEGKNGRWSGHGNDKEFPVWCNVYRDGNRLALVGTRLNDWIQAGREFQWIAEFR